MTHGPMRTNVEKAIANKEGAFSDKEKPTPESIAASRQWASLVDDIFALSKKYTVGPKEFSEVAIGDRFMATDLILLTLATLCRAVSSDARATLVPLMSGAMSSLAELISSIADNYEGRDISSFHIHEAEIGDKLQSLKEEMDKKFKQN